MTAYETTDELVDPEFDITEQDIIEFIHEFVKKK